MFLMAEQVLILTSLQVHTMPEANDPRASGIRVHLTVHGLYDLDTVAARPDILWMSTDSGSRNWGKDLSFKPWRVGHLHMF